MAGSNALSPSSPLAHGNFRVQSCESFVLARGQAQEGSVEVSEGDGGFVAASRTERCASPSPRGFDRRQLCVGPGVCGARSSLWRWSFGVRAGAPDRRGNLRRHARCTGMAEPTNHSGDRVQRSAERGRKRSVSSRRSNTRAGAYGPAAINIGGWSPDQREA